MALVDSTNLGQSMLPTARRLAMLFAMTSCVMARCCVERCTASSTVITSSATHCSSHRSGVKSERRLRICWRKRIRNAGVSSGGRFTRSPSARASVSSFARSASRRRVTHSSADCVSAASRAARTAMWRTFSRKPIRSMAGIAHSSPMVSGVTRWYCRIISDTLAASRRPSVCAISSLAIS